MKLELGILNRHVLELIKLPALHLIPALRDTVVLFLSDWNAWLIGLNLDHRSSPCLLLLKIQHPNYFAVMHQCLTHEIFTS